MTLSAPDWLKRHGGELKPEPGEACVVYFDGEPQYRLTALPVKGQIGCAVMQLNNGKRLDRGGVFSSMEEAFRGGLEELRAALGW